MSNAITVLVNGRAVSVPEGSMASAAVALAGLSAYRKSVHSQPRGPLCGMGICFECRVTIDGQPHCRSCQTVCRPGMEITTDAP
jgi:predicted molibdopterin-dependent oxidoreductase YjgC